MPGTRGTQRPLVTFKPVQDKGKARTEDGGAEEDERDAFLDECRRKHLAGISCGVHCRPAETDGSEAAAAADPVLAKIA